MIQIRNTGTKGLGIFATQTIAIGTRVLSEKPLFTISNARDVYGAVRCLNRKDRAAFWDLSNGHGSTTSLLTKIEAVFMTAKEAFKFFMPSKDRGVDSDSPRTRPTIAKYLLARSIFLSNNFALSTSPALRALFPQISRLNHDCVPNAQGNWNGSLEPPSFTIHTLREVTADEELTLSYLSDPGALHAERRNSLEGFGFACTCAICQSGSTFAVLSEERRNQVRERLENFARASEDESVKDKPTELQVMRSMLADYEKEGVRGRELATMYLAAANLAKREGEMEKARALAVRGLELEQISVGADSTLFEQSLQTVRDMDLGALTGEARPTTQNP